MYAVCNSGECRTNATYSPTSQITAAVAPKPSATIVVRPADKLRGANAVRTPAVSNAHNAKCMASSHQLIRSNRFSRLPARSTTQGNVMSRSACHGNDWCSRCRVRPIATHHSMSASTPSG